MKFEIQRESIVKPLQMVSGVVEKKQTLPILSNILLNLERNKLTITATDLEMEVIATTPLISNETGAITVPVRKFFDTCKTLEEGSQVKFSLDGEKAILSSNKTRFRLTTLPAKDFPVIDTKSLLFKFNIPQKELKRLVDKTSFAMAFQDVRYYLNGLLIEIDKNSVKAVATDGHRLAVCKYEQEVNDIAETRNVIIPRKAILEISRLLEDTEEVVEVSIGENFIRLTLDDLIFTSKLVDGQYPNYQSVIPAACEKQIISQKNLIKQCLIRTSILSNEKYRGIKLDISNDVLKASANNPEQEEAQDEIPIEYQGERLEIGFNVNYLLDAISAIDTDNVSIGINDSNGSTLIKAVDSEDCMYVVMPMRL